MADIVQACPNIVRMVVTKAGCNYIHMVQAREWGLIDWPRDGSRTYRQMVKATMKGHELNRLIKGARKLCQK